MSTSYTGGTNFSWPVKGETNWDTIVDAALSILSAHNHQGSGLGATLSTASYSADSVTGAKIRLNNNEALRARNAAGSADVDLLKLDTSNRFQLLGGVAFGSTETITSGAASASTVVTVVNPGSNITVTLPSGVTGQLKLFVTTSTTFNVTIAPGVSNTIDDVVIYPNGWAAYIYLNAAWQLLCGQKCVNTDSVQSVSGGGNAPVNAFAYTTFTGGAASYTLTDGKTTEEGTFVNTGTGNATVTPSTTTNGINTFVLLPQGTARVKFVSGEYRILPGPGCIVTDDVTTITADNTYVFQTKNIICNKGSALAITLSDGVEGQEVNVANIGAGTATITPSTSAGTNTAAIVTNGFCRYTFLGGEWRAVAGAGCTLS